MRFGRNPIQTYSHEPSTAYLWNKHIYVYQKGRHPLHSERFLFRTVTISSEYFTNDFYEYIRINSYISFVINSDLRPMIEATLILAIAAMWGGFSTASE